MNLAAGDPRAAIDALRPRYGDAFVFGFGPIRFHWLIGAAANRFVLHEAASAFRNRRAYRFLEPIGGPTALIVSDEPDHLRRRRRVQPAFHRTYQRAWTRLAASAFEAWADEALTHGTTSLQASLRPVVLDLVIDVLLGSDVRTRHPGLRTDVARMMAFANQPFLAQLLRVPLPGTPWRRLVAARRRVHAALAAEIDRRRARRDASAGSDVLSLLLGSSGAGPSLRDEAPSDQGPRDPGVHDPGVHDPGLSDEELRDQTVSLLAAGFDTTTAALVWCAWLLCDASLRARVEAAVDGLDDVEAASARPEVEALWREALRLYPPAPAILRVSAEAVHWRGSHLPAGALVALSTYHTQRDPTTWREPTAARLERWLESDGPWAAPRDPFAYLPFGHGPRLCIGAGLARTLAGAWLAVALRRARWQALRPDAVRPVGTTLAPADGLALRILPKPPS
jgi:cytochrome P450